MNRRKVMVVIGTRPEAIKMAPVVRELQRFQNEIECYLVATGQHRQMLDQVLDAFDLRPDADLGIMGHDQSLVDVTVRALTGLESTLQRETPDLVLVQGDTTTALMGGLAAFYQHVPVGHVEAGLRTGDKYNPYPEEINRRFLDILADLNFAPTSQAKKAMLNEGIPGARILVTGNTVVDALLTTASRPHVFAEPVLSRLQFGPQRRTVLVTSHRRENLGEPMRDICSALRDLLSKYQDLQVVFPVHLNPKVRAVVWEVLGNIDRAWLIDPLNYLDLVELMKRVDLVVTDSGGIQEEAPALGKPVLVVRSTTERPEGVQAGTARLVGTAREDIVDAVSRLLDDPRAYAAMQKAVNPYGDGRAAERIVGAVRHFLGLAATLPQPFTREEPMRELAGGGAISGWRTSSSEETLGYREAD